MIYTLRSATQIIKLNLLKSLKWIFSAINKNQIQTAHFIGLNQIKIEKEKKRKKMQSLKMKKINKKYLMFSTKLQYSFDTTIFIHCLHCQHCSCLHLLQETMV